MIVLAVKDQIMSTELLIITYTGELVFVAFMTWLVLKKRIAALEVVIAQKDNLIANKDKLIVEKDKLIAETRILKIGEDRAQLTVVTEGLHIQEQLKIESIEVRNSHEELTAILDDMSIACSNGLDVSSLRNSVMSCILDRVVFNFSNYVEKATQYYSRSEPLIIEGFIQDEIIPFIGTLANVLNTINSSEILDLCSTSIEPLQLTAHAV